MKRVLSLIMVLAMVLAMVPAVFAADTAVVSSGTATADADSKWTYMYTPAVDGVLTVTVGDGNAAWASDIMDFSDYSDIEDVTGTAEGSYTHAVTGGVTYSVRIFGQGDPSTAISNIPYSISFAANETEDLGEAIKTGTASCYEETFTGEGKTWTEFLPEEIKITAPANGTVVVNLKAPTNVAAAAEPMWSCEAVGTKFPSRQATDGTYRFDVYSGQEYTVAIGAYDAYEDESTAPKYISGDVAYEIYFLAGEVELKDYVVNNHYPLDVEVDDAMVLDYVTSGKEERNYTPNSVFSGESVVNVSEKVTVEVDPTAKVTITPFEPAMDANGTYKFTAPEGVTLSYWGTQSALPVLQEKDAALADNVIYATVDNGIWNLCKPVINMMGAVSEDENDWYWLWSSSQMLIGVEGATGEVELTIEKTAALPSLEADISGEDTPNYSIKHGFPTGFYNLADDAVLEAVNLEEDHTAVKGDDGYYHLDTVDGPIVYVDTETSYISLSTLVSATALNVTYVNDDGEEVKENFGSAMRTYADKLSATDGIYPLTRDLEIFLSHYGWQTDLEALPYDYETADANTALMSVCRIVAGSAGEEEKNELAIGQNEIAVPADGVTYTYNVIADGNMNITVEECDAASYEYVVSVNGEELVFADDAGVYEGALPVAVKVDDEIAVAVYTYDEDGNEAAGNVALKLAYVIPSSTEEIVFQFGENVAVTDDATDHVDGSKTSPIEETVGEYTLSLTDTGETQLYYGAIDEMGNSCIKLGKSSGVGGFTFTVPEEVTSVVFAVAGYKAKTVTVNVNGVNHAISTTSNNGAYTDITVDTSVTKAITFKTTSTGYRAMIDSITYVITTGGCEHVANGEGVVTAPTCTADGYTTYTCVICGEEYTGNPVAATGHDHKEEVTTAATCTTDGVKTFTCACGDSYTETIYAAHDYVDGVCSVCGAKEYVLVTAPEAGVAYKLGMEQGNLGRDLYFTGEMSGNYGATSHIIENGVEVYLEAAESGYHIYFTDANGVKQYINITVNATSSKTYVNFGFAETASTVFTYNTEYNTMVTNVTVDGTATDYYFGTYNNYDTISASKDSFLGGSSNFPAHFYAAPAAEEEPSNTISIETFGNIDWTAPASGTVTFTGDGAFMILDGSSTMMDMPAETATIDVVEGKVYTFYNEQYGQVVNVTYAYAPAEEEPEVITGSVSVESFGNIDWTAPESGTVTFTADGSFMIMKGWDYMMDSPAATATLNVVKGETYTIANEQYGVAINVTYTYGEDSGETTLPAGMLNVESYSSGTRWVAPATGNVTFTADGAFVLLDSANNLVAEMVTTATTDVNEGDELYFIETNGVNLTVNYAYNSVAGGSGDAEIVYKDLTIGYNSIAQQDVNYKYTATEAGMLTLSLSAQSVNGTVSAQYAVNGENAQTLAEGGYAEMNLVPGDVVTVNVTATGYNTLVAAWYPTAEESAELVLGDNNVEVAESMTGASWTYTATEAGTLTVTATLQYLWDEAWYETDAAGYGRMIQLLVDGNNAYSNVNAVTVEAGQVVTIQVINNFGYATKGTLNLAMGAGSEGGEDEDPNAGLYEGTGAMDDPYMIPSLAEAVVLTVVDDTYFVYTAEKDGTITFTESTLDQGWLYKLNDGYYSSGDSVDVVTGDVLYINPYYAGTLTVSYKAEGGDEPVVPGGPDGTWDAPFIIDEIPVEFTPNLAPAWTTYYYQHTATEAGILEIATPEGVYCEVIINGEYADGTPVAYAAGDVIKVGFYAEVAGEYPVILLDAAVAQNGDAKYVTVSEALEKAEAGDTVTLLANAEDSYIIITPGVTLDLGSYTLTADYVIGLNGSGIVATAMKETNGVMNEYGKLVVDPDNISLASNAPDGATAGYKMIPVWNEDHYCFSLAGITKQEFAVEASNDGKATIKFQGNFTSYVKNNLFADNGSGDNGMSVIVRVSYTETLTNGKDVKVTREYYYTEELIQDMMADDKLTASLIGCDALKNLVFSIAFVTEAGAEVVSQDYVYADYIQ